jgi:hypothetical protein
MVQLKESIIVTQSLLQIRNIQNTNGVVIADVIGFIDSGLKLHCICQIASLSSVVYSISL